MGVNEENFYWLFSSSAQAISTFVAFLLTGFALVVNVMDGLQSRDETLEELHAKLKTDYYGTIKILAWTTAAAVILSLIMVYLNGFDYGVKPWLYTLTGLINLIAIILGTYFVVSIINPNRYKRAAKEIINEDKNEFSLTGNKADQLVFMTEFIKLEKSIREVLRTRQLYSSFGEGSKMAYSFREMSQALFQNELINEQTINQLLIINKYRNLIFHGHQDKVDVGMIDRIRQVQKVIDLIDGRSN